MVGSAQYVMVVPVSSVGSPCLSAVPVGHRVLVGLRPDVAVAADLHLEPGGQRVHHGDADAVQAAGHRVGVAVELAAGVQRGEHDLDAPAPSPPGARRPGCRGRRRCTWTPPSARSITPTLVAKPAIASSTELSTTSQIRWCRPRSPVEPMYMPGRLRTASRPSSTVMDLALYSALLFAATSFAVSLWDATQDWCASLRGRTRPALPCSHPPESIPGNPVGKVARTRLRTSQKPGSERTRVRGAADVTRSGYVRLRKP